MTFDELDTRMRVFETAHDHCVLPGIRMVARLDGRGFTRLTKEILPLERPFDGGFRDHLTATAAQLIATSGFRVLYGYCQSDEISLLLHPGDGLFGRKLRKIVSVLAGEASADLSLRLGVAACLDCRVSQLPSDEHVVDYFRWRAADAHRNALNAHCYWALRADGLSGEAADRRLRPLSVSDKNEFLFGRGTNFNDLPAWQRRGVGLWWEDSAAEGRNPVSGEVTQTTRRRIRLETDLPTGDAYGILVRDRLSSA